MFLQELLASVDIIFDPVKVLKRALELKKYWIPMALILVVLSAFIFYTAPIQHADQVQYIKNNPNIMKRINKEQIEKMKEYNPSRFIPQMLIGIIVTIPLMILFLAAFINWFAQLADIDSTYLQALTIASYASYIDLLWGSIIKNILALSKGTFLSVSTSLTLFAHNLNYTSKTYKILASFDFFNIWSYIIIALGISLLPKGSIKKGAIIAGSIYLIKIVITIGFSMIF